MTPDQADILIVDDTPENLKLLASMLQDRGYRVRKSTNGKRAIQAIELISPDLILLDVMMPEMNGYQVAEYLKSQPGFDHIPIIFLSALSDTADKVSAFAAGAVDYITKPFQVQEVLVRVRTQLTLQQQKQQLIQSNQQLQQEIQERRKAEAALRVYIHAMSHDLRNPVTGMLMVLHNTLKQPVNSSRQIPVEASVLKRMAEGCDRQLNLINSLIETSDSESQGLALNRKPLDLAQLTQQFLAAWEPLLQKSHVSVENHVSSELPRVNADPDQLWRVLDNLVSNAVKYNPPGITLTFDAESGKDEREASTLYLRYSVTDNGVGIDPEEIANLFDLYYRGKHIGKIKGLGLGLYLCRQIITAHDGSIGRSPIRKGDQRFGLACLF